MADAAKTNRDPEAFVSHPRPVAPSRPRRATVRYRCAPATIGKLYLSGEQVSQNAWLQNLSATGVGIILPQPVDVGVFVTVQIKCIDPQQTYELSAHVVHAAQQVGGDWVIGCELLNPLSAEDLDRLL
jgi:hypothetical protein